MRANRGHIHIARTPRIISKDWPIVTTNTSATRINGIARIRSTRRITTSSTHPPYQPDTSPNNTPSPPPIPRVTAATTSEMRAPNIIRLRMSRPNWSVPNKYSVLPPAFVPGPEAISIVSPMFTFGSCSRAFSSDTWELSCPG